MYLYNPTLLEWIGKIITFSQTKRVIDVKPVKRKLNPLYKHTWAVYTHCGRNVQFFFIVICGLFSYWRWNRRFVCCFCVTVRVWVDVLCVVCSYQINYSYTKIFRRHSKRFKYCALWLVRCACLQQVLHSRHVIWVDRRRQHCTHTIHWFNDKFQTTKSHIFHWK